MNWSHRCDPARSDDPTSWLSRGSTLTAHHLAGEFGAVTSNFGDAGPVSGEFTATEPFAVRIDLDALV